MASITYNRFRTNILSGSLNLGTGGNTLKAALVTTAYTPTATHNVWSDVSTNELTGATGYTAGGATLSGQTVSQNDVSNLGVFNASQVSWSGFTGTCRYLVIYDTTVSNTLICCIDMGNQVVTSGTLTVAFSASGIIQLA